MRFRPQVEGLELRANPSELPFDPGPFVPPADGGPPPGGDEGGDSTHGETPPAGDPTSPTHSPTPTDIWW